MIVHSTTARRIEEAAIRLFSERGSSQITVQELAKEAGVARGTIYNNVDSTEGLFERIAARLADEMHRRVTASLGYVDDPALGLAHDVRFFIRRAHEEPAWGWFIYRFGLSDDSLRDLLHGRPMKILARGRDLGRYDFREPLTQEAMTLTVGSTLAAMYTVLEGHRTWREAGSATAELILRALGLDAQEAQRIAHLELPALRPLDSTVST